MTAYDARAKSTAARMLAPVAAGGKGALVTISSPGSPGTYDPMTDTTTGVSAPVEQISSGVEEKVSTYSVANNLAAAGDLQFLLSALVFTAEGKVTSTPLVAPVADRDTLTKADGVWAIKKVDPIKPAGTPIMYTLTLRRGA